MSTETYRERLVKVREAIDRIMNGAQSWRFNDRQYTRADLATLERMEKRYARLAAQEDSVASGRGGSSRIRYVRF